MGGSSAGRKTSRRRRLARALGGAIAAAALAGATAMAESWIYAPSGGGAGSARVGGYPDFAMRLGCLAPPARGEAAALYGVEAPAPILIFISAQGFVRDLHYDLDRLPPIEVVFLVDGRLAGALAFEHSARSRAFVGAAPSDGGLIEALQSGERMAARARGLDAYGEATLAGSRRAIDLLRDRCPEMSSSRPLDMDGRSPLAAEIEIPVKVGPDFEIRVIAPLP